MNKEQLYKASNSVEIVTFKSIARAQIERLLACGESLEERQKIAQAYINYLCDKANIPRATVRVVNTPQPHDTNENGRLTSKILGTYTTRKAVITMYNLTAKQRKVVAIKTFIGTLHHEYMHHYDMFFLKFPDSYHTRGFYSRINDLQKKAYKE